MAQRNKMVEWAVWGTLAATIITISTAFVLQRQRESAADKQMPWPEAWSWPIPAFALTNQFGKEISNTDLKGKVWLANIIFTRCAGACPQMTGKLAELQSAFASEDDVRFVSMTSDAGYDTPAILKAYADHYKAAPDRWWFLTGNKADVNALATNGMKLTALDVNPEERVSPEDLFIHSTLLVLVDRQGRFRGSVESLEPDWKEKALKGVRGLLKEAQ